MQTEPNTPLVPDRPVWAGF